MPWLGLDIGGANIKLSDGGAYAESHPFPLWQRPDDLAQVLRERIAAAPNGDRLAITMTGELADCFATKAEGVQRILEAVAEAADHRRVAIYTTAGFLPDVAVARQKPSVVAAANWHALARFSGRFAPLEPALLIDIGSTSTDIIPLAQGMPAAIGRNDTERLIAGELVYSGASRTPLCGLVSHVPWRGTRCPVAREWFATTQDVYLVTGDVREDPTSNDTADGRPATGDAARIRLARMVCADDASLDDASGIAQFAAVEQARQIAAAIRQVVERTGMTPEKVIISGEGEFLARRALDAAALTPQLVSLQDQLGHIGSQCAPAHAVAVLAAEEVDG